MRVIVLHQNDEYICAALLDKKLTALNREPAEGAEIAVGEITVGRVENCVTSMQAAFVRFHKDEIGFLPFSKVPEGALVNRPYDGKEPLKQGDMLPVQVERLKSGMKQAALTGYYSISSQFTVVTYGTAGFGISKKISDERRPKMKEDFQEALKMSSDKEFITNALLKHALVIRTDAAKLFDTDPMTAPSRLLEDVRQVLRISANIRTRAGASSAGSSLYCPDPMRQLTDTVLRQVRFLKKLEPENEVDIVCDNNTIFQSIQKQLTESNLQQTEIKLYRNQEPSLDEFFQISSQISELQKRMVWLKSGGLLVFDKTEAMTVIDVNSGKNISKKKDDFLSLNMEAAKEIFRQLRIRDVTGIIIVDFINMNHEKSRHELKNELKRLAALDPVQTQFVDFTKLGLAELTRQRHG